MKTLKKAALAIILNALAMFALTEVVEGITYTGGLTFFITTGILIGVLNTFVKPVIKLVTLPVIFLSGGLVLIVINAGIFWFLEYFLEVAQFRDVSIQFANTFTYVIGSIAFGLINWVEGIIFKVE